MSVDQVFKLAIQCQQKGRLSEAEELYNKILEAQSNHSGAWHYGGLIAFQKGNKDRAIEYISKAVSINPDYAEAHNNLGNVLKACGQYEEAIAHYKRAITIKPRFAEAHNNLGNIYSALEKPVEALTCFQEAIAINPSFAEMHNNLSKVLFELGQLKDAGSSFQKAISLNPDHFEVHNNLGNAFKSQGRLEDAVACYQRAIAIKPDYGEVYNNLGVALKAQGKLEDAVACYKRSLNLNAEQAETNNNLGNALNALGKPFESIPSYQEAIQINPNLVEAHSNLGNAYKDSGMLKEAVAKYEHAMDLRPAYAVAYSNLLLAIQYGDDYDSEALYKKHCGYAKRHEKQIDDIPPFENTREQGKRLKIGYVSPDFRNHSVGFFLEPILTHHSVEQYEIYCYSLVINPDETTERLKARAHHWISIVGMADDEVATRILNDGIDILVDLAGHTGSNRLPIFTRKPAPVQVSYLGYPNTTGLSKIDYRVTDAYADPPGKTEKWHTEKLIRLENTAWCYRPVENAPEVTKLPAKAKGHITFGSFNAFPKLNETVLKLWAKLLTEIDHSHLFLKARSLADDGVQKQVIKQLKEEGISPERILLTAQEPSYHRHLERYHEVDIALDTYPYHGTTTTCEALWMGVPVVTLEGESHRSRVGVSLLNQVGLKYLIAKSPEEYIRIASTLANDLDALAKLRNSLRSHMQASPIMDEVGFTKGLETAYREMWCNWCAKQ